MQGISSRAPSHSHVTFSFLITNETGPVVHKVAVFTLKENNSKNVFNCCGFFHVLCYLLLQPTKCCFHIKALSANCKTVIF